MWSAEVGPAVAGALALGCGLALSGVTVVVARDRPGRPRWSGTAGVAVTAALFAAAIAVAGWAAAHDRGSGPDRAALGWFVERRHGLLTTAAELVSDLGGTVGMTVVAATATVLLWWRSERAMAAVVATSGLGAGVLVWGFKNLYARPRPPVADRLAAERTFSMPSGHALGSIVVLGVVAAVVVLLVGRPVVRVLVGSAAGAAVVAIGLSRLYLGVHWFSDVAAGWLLGGAWSTLWVTVLLALGPATPGPVTPEPVTGGPGAEVEHRRARVVSSGRRTPREPTPRS